VSNSTADTMGQMEKLAIVILQRMEQLIGMHVSAVIMPHVPLLIYITLQNQILGMDDRNNWNDLQSNFCSVLIVSFRCLHHKVQLAELCPITEYYP
jgi:importin subunit beta-1